MAEKKKFNLAHEIGQLAVLALAVLGVHSAVAKPFYIPSESMMPTLLVGDRLVVTKYPYGYSYLSPSLPVLPPMRGRVFGRYPTQGDIIVLKSPVEHVDYIKRVIALPGDTVQVKNGVLFLNGKAVKHQAAAPIDVPVSANTSCDRFPQFRAQGAGGMEVCRYPRIRETLPNGVSYDTIDADPNSMTDNTPPYAIPQGYLFVMGDNRDNSADSRVSPDIGGIGLLPLENVVGRAEFITFSLDGSTEIFNPASWFHALRSGRAGTSLHPVQGD